jgi:lysozyme
VHEGLVWTQDVADLTFADYDLNYAEHAVTTLVLVPLTQNQFDALVSLVYNIGVTAFKNSTLLRLLNSHDYSGASAQFLVWDHSGGVVSLGLHRRRVAEQQVFGAIPLAIGEPPAVAPIPAPAPTGWAAVLNFLLSLFKKGS